MEIGRVRNGAIFISAGVVLLLNTTGYLSWTVWANILSLWPVALIAIGIELLFKKTRLSFITLLSPLLFLAAILGPAFFHGEKLGEFYNTSRAYYWSEDLDPALTRATIRVQLNAGTLNISSGADKLISAELDYFKREPLITYDYTELDSSAVVNITDNDRALIRWKVGKGWFGKGWNRKDWTITLTDQIPLSLKINAKATRGELNLSDLKLKNLELDIKASSLDLKLGGRVEEVDATIDSDASKLYLLIPEDVGLKIENHAKLSSTSFSKISIMKYDSIYQTSNFDQAPQKIRLFLGGSVTKLVVKSYPSLETI